LAQGRSAQGGDIFCPKQKDATSIPNAGTTYKSQRASLRTTTRVIAKEELPVLSLSKGTRQSPSNYCQTETDCHEIPRKEFLAMTVAGGARVRDCSGYPAAQRGVKAESPPLWGNAQKKGL